LARGSWIAELAAQSLHPRKLPACLSGEQHQSYVLYVARRGVALPFTCRRACAGGATQSGQWRALQDLLHQAAPRYIKALKRQRAGSTKNDEADRCRDADRQISFADLELTLQACGWSRFCNDLRFSGRQEEMIDQVRRDLERGLKNQRLVAAIDTATSSALAGSHARQELALSGAARTDRRRNHAAPVHGARSSDRDHSFQTLVITHSRPS